MDKELAILEFDKVLRRLGAHAVSECGRQYCFELRPYPTLSQAQRALEQTAGAERLLLDFGAPSLSGVSDVTSACSRAANGAVLTAGELLAVAGVLRAADGLHSYLSEHCREDDVFDEPRQRLCPNRRLYNLLEASFDGEGQVSDSASPELARIRRRIAGARDRIKSALNDMLRTHSKYLQDGIITVRGGRYVIPVKSEYRSEVNGLVHDTSSSGATLFVEPMQVVQANNDVSVLEAQERAEIERILADLSAQVGQIAAQITVDFEICRFFDFCFAKARYAVETRSVKPELNLDGIIDARMVRHPLIDAKTCVPIDVVLGREYSALIVTGPNTGGKTVSLKTTGLICLMAKSGLFVPAAAGAEVAFFDSVFADIGDEQSIEQSLSTFSAHMSNIVSIIDRATSGSLVLLDELGSGTDPVEGAALAIAIIERLRSEGVRLVCTSHYSELKLYALQTKGVENASCEFDVATLRPTYRLIIGVPGKSNAFAIAARLGLDGSVIEEAQSRLDAGNVKVESVLADLEIRRKAAEDMQAHAEKLRDEAYQALQAAKRAEADAIDQRNSDINDAKDEASRIIERARRDAEAVLDKADEIRRAQDRQDFRERIAQGRAEIRDRVKQASEGLAPNEPQTKPIEGPLNKGDSVRVARIGRDAVVLSEPDKNGMLMIQAGAVKMRVHVSDIERSASKKKSVVARSVNTGVSKSSRDVHTEIDIRGMTAYEAESRVDEFLDECALCGLHTVSIIHGKGTGALRAAVHDRLRRSPLVESFRLGVYGEGETGVTIVTLK